MSRRRLFALGCFGVGILAVLAIGLGVVASRYMRYRDAGGAEAIDPTLPQIAISSPAGGAALPVGSPVNVQAVAIGYDPFLSTELWVDGVLAGVEAGPSGGVTPFNADFTWFPIEPGVHQLVARAMDAGRNVASSAGVLVVVLPDETLAEAAPEGEGAQPVAEGPPSAEEGETGQAAGEAATTGGSPAPVVFPQAAPEAAQPPAPPGPDASVGPSQPWSGTPGNWITSLTAQAAPNAPQLVGGPAACGANLTIQDTSDNEEGFLVFRLGLNAPGWTQIAALASQSQNDWITFSDSDISGPISYYVSAFNSQGESASNIVLVNVDPAGCPPPSEELPVLTVELSSLIPKLDVEQAYCYQSLGGLHWTRLPEFGFFTPGEDGLDIEGQIEKLLLTDFDGEPLFETLELKLECWGWDGGALTFLGEFAEVLDLANPTDLLVEGEGLSAEVLVREGDWPEPAYFDVTSSALLSKDWAQFFFPPKAAQMPWISAWLTYDPEVCKAHASLWPYMCFNPLKGFNLGPGGVNPQPYLVWLVHPPPGCPAQSWEDCLPFSWWVAYAQAKGYELIWWIELAPYEHFWGFVEPSRTVWRYNCYAGSVAARVKMQIGKLGLLNAFESTPSNWVDIPCGTPIGDTVLIEVTFQTLHLDNVDDDDWPEEEDVEVYGRFEARQSSWTTAAGRVVVASAPQFCSLCQPPFTDGDYPLSARSLCVAPAEEVKKFSSGDPNLCPYKWHKKNNKLVLAVQDGDAIKLAVDLTDHDEWSGDDPVCITSLWTESKTLLQWAVTSNETYQLSADHNNADCKVDIVLNAVAP
ncbi:MAG: hypothetical protein ACE5OS_14830 [Anaerolineae bacterium]